MKKWWGVDHVNEVGVIKQVLDLQVIGPGFVVSAELESLNGRISSLEKKLEEVIKSGQKKQTKVRKKAR